MCHERSEVSRSGDVVKKLSDPATGVGRRRLSHAQIVSATVDLIDEEGIAAASMRTVARRLHVQPMTLHRYVDNREDLSTPSWIAPSVNSMTPRSTDPPLTQGGAPRRHDHAVTAPPSRVQEHLRPPVQAVVEVLVALGGLVEVQFVRHDDTWA